MAIFHTLLHKIGNFHYSRKKKREKKDMRNKSAHQKIYAIKIQFHCFFFGLALRLRHHMNLNARFLGFWFLYIMNVKI